MALSTYILGDWGTTNGRLCLYRDGKMVDRRDISGFARGGDIASTFHDATRDWDDAEAAFLCGMIGARGGWQEVPYLVCPATPASLRERALRIAGLRLPVWIVPGLICENPIGAQDVMRGEETQLVGAFASGQLPPSAKSVAILPGTHSKWVLFQGGAVITFQTIPTGDIFASLRDHATLGRALDGAHGAADPAAFTAGVARILEHGPAGFFNSAFETRSQQILAGQAGASALAFLSGLLIGAEIGSMSQHFDAPGPVHLIGAPALCALYTTALGFFSRTAQLHDGDACAFAGLRHLFGQMQ